MYVPGTDPQAIPDVPGTDPQPIPDVPGTDPQPIPNVPGVDEGDLGTAPGQDTPEYKASATAYYVYHAPRVEDNKALTAFGQAVYAPFGPGDTTWFVGDGGAAAALDVTVTLYENGEEATTQTIGVPYIGQVLAAVEYSAGTLP